MKRNLKKATILLTGGHAATTALAVIEQLKEDHDVDWEVSWVGPKQALSSGRLAPFELSLFPKLDVHVYAIQAGKIQSKFTRHTIPELLKIPRGFWQALHLMRKIKPDIILSFGGFAAVPVIFAGWLYRKPIIIHEQISGAGLANKVSSVFATTVAIARSESRGFFPKERTQLVGNPLMSAIREVAPKKKISATPVVYVTGGSRGAQRLNNLIFESLPSLLESFSVIHQTGALDKSRADEKRKALSPAMQKKYEVHDFINPLEVSKMYTRADIVVGRSGANTVSEIVTIGIPSIFIPIPWSRGDEQTKNAQYAQKLGIAHVLPESEMNTDVFLKLLTSIKETYATMVHSIAEYKNPDRKAVDALVSLLKTHL